MLVYALSRYREKIVYPAAAIGAVDLIGVIAEHTGAVQGWYASPLVLAVAVVAVHFGRVPGHVAAVLAILSFNFLFVKPAYVFTWPMNEEIVAYASMMGAAFLGVVACVRDEVEPVHRSPLSLPFTKRRRQQDGSGIICWDVPPASGNWRSDTDLGAEYARVWMARVQNGDATALAWIVRDMIAAGAYTGIECGFMSALQWALPAHDSIRPVLVPVRADDDAGDLLADKRAVEPD